MTADSIGCTSVSTANSGGWCCGDANLFGASERSDICSWSVCLWRKRLVNHRPDNRFATAFKRCSGLWLWRATWLLVVAVVEIAHR
ncbi:hypothetical protein HC891_26265 [Candidatus Gracilibacteria bacterium]|nr:hypothetical protein [Candidatus Gracilibacteria bacterium]